VGDALNWVTVAGVDAGEEGGAEGKVCFVTGSNDCGHFNVWLLVAVFDLFFCSIIFAVRAARFLQQYPFSS
jgi:hypothetical protein